jgi:tRNA(Ile)-lysidine synthase
MAGTKKLSDYYTDRKIDRPLREEIPLLCCGREVLWIVGEAISEGVKVSSSTQEVLRLEVDSH